MLRAIRNVLFGLALLGLAFPQCADARVIRTFFPLSGHRGYISAKGNVTFVDVLGEPGREDGTTLVIEVSTVPLPPGTELLVFINDVEVSTLKLDKEQNGRLVLEGKSGKPAPKVKVGSFVVLKLADGSTVIW